MNNDGKNVKDEEILNNLKFHLASLPDKKATLLLPQCHCLKLLRPLIEKGVVSGSRVCQCCNSLTGWRKRKNKQCPFED